MSRDAAVAARKERNAALVEAMVMAAVADGTIAQREMQTLIRRVVERPEFEGTKPEELNALIEGSAKKLAHAKNLEEVLRSLRERLPDHKNRLLAFGLAAAVALADRKATREELGLLKTFQMGLGISESEVQDVFSAVESNKPLNEVLGEPKERLYAEVMVLVSVADGKVSAAEASAIVEALAGDPVFRELSIDRAQLFVRDAMQALSDDGMSKRLVVMAHSLTTHPQRRKAYGLAARVAKAGGNRPSELHVLEMLQATFGLADDEVERIERGLMPRVQRDFVRFALPPSLGEVEAKARAQKLETHFQQGLKKRTEIHVANSYESLAKDLLSGKVDAAWAPPFVCARIEAMGVRVLVRGVRGGASSYRAALLCRAESPLTLDTLGGRSAVWTDRDSVGGYLLPMALLRGRGLDPNKLFQKQEFAGSYKAAVEAVLNESADVTSVFAPSGKQSSEKTGIDEVLPGRQQDLHIIAFTDESPNDGVAVSMSAASGLVQDLERLLLSLHESGPGTEILKETFRAEKFEVAQRMGYRALYRVALASL